MHKIGIIGAGWVGTACEINFASMPKTEVSVYDKFKSTESLHTVVENSDILFVCVPTPMREDGSCDTDIVFDAVFQVNKLAEKEKVIVIKSTVPPGTTAKLQRDFKRHHFFFNPEFLTQANFIKDFWHQQRIILGQTSRGQNKKLTSFYEDFIRHQATDPHCDPAFIYSCDSNAAEMMKYATNCFLAAKVTFFNEIYDICDATGTSFKTVIELMKLDERIGTTHMEVPGPDGYRGYGGSCFPKDLSAFISFMQANAADSLLLESVWAKNLLVREECKWKDLPQVTGEYRKTS